MCAVIYLTGLWLPSNTWGFTHFFLVRFAFLSLVLVLGPIWFPCKEKVLTVSHYSNVNLPADCRSRKGDMFENKISNLVTFRKKMNLFPLRGFFFISHISPLLVVSVSLFKTLPQQLDLGTWPLLNLASWHLMISKHLQGSKMTQGPMLGSKLTPETLLSDYF